VWERLEEMTVEWTFEETIILVEIMEMGAMLAMEEETEET